MEEKDASSNQRPKKASLILTLLTVIIFALVAAVVWLFVAYQSATSSYKSVLTPELRQQAGFPVYYPSELPNGYKLDKESVDIHDGALFLKLTGGSKTITISQVKMPKNDPGLSWEGFGELSLPIGKAYTGRYNGRPVALIDARTTLINITASADVSDDVINSLALKLKALD